ncbi:MAG TPA: choice-of-anchor D domain-containing protein [Terriglobia bacterium]|nr:choice-of-anchor D domain-containing protein [Terriglobia bacterium]
MTLSSLKKLWLVLPFVAGFLLPYQAFGQNLYDVQVGYSDDYNPNPSPNAFFPVPWQGSPGITNFIGSPAGSLYDGGTIRIDNTSGAPLLINGVSVVINGVGPIDLWGSFTIPIGGIAILAQTIEYNFDTSDLNPIAPCLMPVAPGTTPFPTVTVTANGTPTTFNDTAHILDAEGDNNGCPNGTNESEQWRLIGTAGGQGGETLSPSDLNFGDQLLGSTSAPQIATLTNTGTAALTISSVAISGDFAQTNKCPASLPAGSACTITVTFTPTQTGSRSGTLTVTDDAPAGTTQTVSLTGTGTQAVASLSPPSLSFANQALGTTSPGQSITVSNTGTAAFTVSSITISGSNGGDFAETNTCSTVAASATCTITVTFAPTQAGIRSGILTVSDSASAGGTQSVNLTGTGAGAAANLSPGLLYFGSQAVGSVSPAQTITLSNTGTLALTISSVKVSGADGGDFSETNTCGISVAAGANCTISVTFKPIQVGNRSATLTISDNASPSSTQTVSLTGNGVAAIASLSPTSLSFASQAVGTTSSAQTVTLSNTGTLALSISSVGIGGDFAETNTCGSSVAANASCTITVTFTPSAPGSRTGTLTVTDNSNGVANNTQTVALTGTGLGATATLSSTSLAFGAENVGASSPASSVTLANSTGNTSLTISSITIGGSDTKDFAIQSSSTCSTKAAVAAGKSCTVSLVFTPGGSGTRTANLTIADNAVGGASQTLMLTGTGKDFALSGLKPASVSPGSSANYTLTLTPQGGFNQAVQVTCAEAAALTESTCTVSPSSVTLNGSAAASATIAVATTAPSFAPRARRSPPSNPFGGPLARPVLWLVVLALLGPASLLRRKRRALLSLAFTALTVLLWASCGGGGGGGGGGGSSNPGTTPGTYNITLTASAGNITHTSTVTLTVQ